MDPVETQSEAVARAEPAEDRELPEEAAVDEVVVDDLASQLEAVVQDRDRLARENEELQDRFLRRQAEFENLRRRVENERSDHAKYAGMKTTRELLPILDDFERAIQAAPQEDGSKSEYVKGVEMIYQRLFDALKKAGLEPIESVGKPFDPHIHHAVKTVETDEAEDHTILEEWQKGYNFRGRLLREAMVKVAVKPS